VRTRAGGEPEAGQARPHGQGGAAAPYGFGHARGPHRHGREGYHKYQDLPRRAPASGSRPALDAVGRPHVSAGLACGCRARGYGCGLPRFVVCWPPDQSEGEPPMRALLVGGVVVVASITPALAAALAPKDIQSTFFNGQPFTSSTMSN